MLGRETKHQQSVREGSSPIGMLNQDHIIQKRLFCEVEGKVDNPQTIRDLIEVNTCEYLNNQHLEDISFVDDFDISWMQICQNERSSLPNSKHAKNTEIPNGKTSASKTAIWNDVSPHWSQSTYFLEKASRVDGDICWDKDEHKGSMRLRSFVATVTVLIIDIKDFTTTCSKLTAGQVGDWVADFYVRVDAVAATHGLRKVEVRGDCCVCVAGTDHAIPWDELNVSTVTQPCGVDPDTPYYQASRALAFAASIHADLATLAGPSGRPTDVRMGTASGDAVFLVGEEAGGGGGFVSVQGEAARLAAALESHSWPGVLLVHPSTAALWATEAPGRLAPPMQQVGGGDGETLEAAAYDCTGWGFGGPGPGLSAALVDCAVAAAPQGCDLQMLPVVEGAGQVGQISFEKVGPSKESLIVRLKRLMVARVGRRAFNRSDGVGCISSGGAAVGAARTLASLRPLLAAVGGPKRQRLMRSLSF